MTNKYDIATAMNSIMASQAVFAKPQPQFTKTAADKNDDGDKVKEAVVACKKVMKDMKCGGSAKASKDTVVITCSDKDAVKKCKAICKKHGVQCEVKEPKQSKASRYHACVMGLAKISEYLDDAGLAKEAAYTLLALDGLVSNAMPSGDDGDCGMAKDKKKGKLPAFLDKDKDGKVDKFKSKSKSKKGCEDDEDEDEDDEDEDDCGSMKSKKAQDMRMPMDYMTGGPQLHPLDPGLDTPDFFLSSTDPNDPLNPWLETPPDRATINAIINARQAYRAAGEGNDSSYADTDDMVSVPAGEGLEEGMDYLGADPLDFPLGEQWLAELDEEELDPKNSPMALMKRKKEQDLRSRMDSEEDAGSYLTSLIDEELEGEDFPETGTEAVASKKLTSLQKVALELRKARRGIRPF